MTDDEFRRVRALASNRLFVDALCANAKYFLIACADDEGFPALDKLREWRFDRMLKLGRERDKKNLPWSGFALSVEAARQEAAALGSRCA